MGALTLSKAGRLAQTHARLSDDSQVAAMSLAALLAEFRKYMERELEVNTLANCQVDAGLFLNDLCEFLELGDAQRLQVVGPAVFECIGDSLPSKSLVM